MPHAFYQRNAIFHSRAKKFKKDCRVDGSQQYWSLKAKWETSPAGDK